MLTQKTSLQHLKTILEVNENDLKIFDFFEFCPDVYRRETITAMQDGTPVECFVYKRVDITADDECEKIAPGGLSGLDMEGVMNEVKHFKEVEHPELYRKNRKRT